MKNPIVPLSLVLTLLGLPALGGCASTGSPSEANAPTATRDLNRADAIASAKQDAAHTYGEGWGANAQAELAGGFWLVELRAASGYRLRYAISARDGSIRERNMMQ